MKVRGGFVTNSSSTSYTIVLRDEAPEGYFSLLELLKIAFSRVELECMDEFGALYFTKTKYNAYHEDSFKILDMETYIRSAKSQVEGYTESIKDTESEIKQVEKILKEGGEAINLFADPWSVTNGSSVAASARTKLNSKLERARNDIKRFQKIVDDHKKQLEVLAEFDTRDSANLTLLFVDVDNWGGSEIERLIEKSKATVLKKERT